MCEWVCKGRWSYQRSSPSSHSWWSCWWLGHWHWWAHRGSTAGERQRLSSVCVYQSSNNTSECVSVLPPYPARPPGVAIDRTSGSCDWSPPSAVDRASLERTEPSGSTVAQSSYIHSGFISGGVELSTCNQVLWGTLLSILCYFLLHSVSEVNIVPLTPKTMCL